MPRLETSGMRNCGVISMSGFSFDHKEEVDTYDMEDFYSEINMSVAQDYGFTSDYKFDSLMDYVEKHCTLKGRMILACLTDTQRFQKDGYWHKKLKSRGFKMVRKSNNSTGSTFYLYTRIPLKLPIQKGQQ